MDKLVFDGRNVTISNDGATIMKLLEIAHPAAKTLVDISLSQVQTCKFFLIALLYFCTSLSFILIKKYRTPKSVMEPHR
jgi:hypothetical protein